MKRLREQGKTRKTVQACGLAKAQEFRDVGSKRKREVKKNQEEEEQNRREKAQERQKIFRDKKRKGQNKGC